MTLYLDAYPAQTWERSDCVIFRKTHEERGGLSNMAAGFPVEVNGIPIRTSEALYQVCRFPGHPEIQREIIDQKSPMAAKMVGKPYRAGETRRDWEIVKVDVMEWCLRVKLAQNFDSFGELLLETGDRDIVEHSHRDDFWGAKAISYDELRGQNVLGKLLMRLRDRLMKLEGDLRVVDPLDIADFSLCGEAIRPVIAIDTSESDQTADSIGDAPAFGSVEQGALL